MRVCRVAIHGRVQGVGFRWSASRAARDLGLAGWVQNVADGSVEALLVGEDDAVEKMLAWCWEGPPSAHVTSVNQRDIGGRDVNKLRGFEIR